MVAVNTPVVAVNTPVVAVNTPVVASRRPWWPTRVSPVGAQQRSLLRPYGAPTTVSQPHYFGNHQSR